MGNSQSICKINFEDMQKATKNTDQYIIISTLPDKQQTCFIPNTIAIADEEEYINKQLKVSRKIPIIIYGCNAGDATVDKKYTQLLGLGFVNVYIYPGGLFEWLLLQDVYGVDEFPTTVNEMDILKYKSPRIFDMRLLTYE